MELWQLNKYASDQRDRAINALEKGMETRAIVRALLAIEARLDAVASLMEKHAQGELVHVRLVDDDDDDALVVNGAGRSA